LGRVLGAFRWVEHGPKRSGSGQLAGGRDTLTDLCETGQIRPSLRIGTGAAVIVVTIPEKKVLICRPLVHDVPDTHVVIATGNTIRVSAMPFDGIESCMMESRQWVAQISGVRSHAFNNIYACALRDLGSPDGTPERVGVAVPTGDNQIAKQS